MRSILLLGFLLSSLPAWALDGTTPFPVRGEAGPYSCGTTAIHQRALRWSELPSAEQQQVLDLLGRPPARPWDPDWRAPRAVYCSSNSFPNQQSSEHFRMVWGNSGAPSANAVNQVLDTMETARQVYVDLGYQEPAGVSAGGGKLTVFAGNTGGGTPNIDFDGGYTTLCDDDWHNTYIVLSGSVLSYTDSIRDVGGHELYHSVQFGYQNWDLDSYYWEGSATWAEELVYPNLDIYPWFLSYYADQPEEKLTLTNGAREYGLFILPMFWSDFEDTGIDLMRWIWETPNVTNVGNAVDDLLQANSDHGFKRSFARFTAHNMLMDYHDANQYDSFYINKTVNSFPANGGANGRPPQKYGTNYMLFQAGEARGTLEVTFTADDASARFVVSRARRINGESGVNEFVSKDASVRVLSNQFGTRNQKVWMAVTNTGTGSMTYTWRAKVMDTEEYDGGDLGFDNPKAEPEDPGAAQGCGHAASNPSAEQSGASCSTPSRASSSRLFLLLGLAILLRRRPLA